MPRGAVKIKVNKRQFNAALKEYAKVTSKTWPEIINAKLKFISYGALVSTKSANANRVRHLLGQESSQIGRVDKSGNYKRYKRARKVYGKDTILHRGIRARREERGERPLSGAELEKEVKKERASRLRGIGYIKSGWLWAGKKLDKIKTASGKANKTGARGLKLFGKPKGFVKPAKKTGLLGKARGIAWSESLQPRSKNTVKKGNPMPIAERGLAISFAKEARSMLEYMASKQRPINKKYGK